VKCTVLVQYRTQNYSSEGRGPVTRNRCERHSQIPPSILATKVSTVLEYSMYPPHASGQGARGPGYRWGTRSGRDKKRVLGSTLPVPSSTRVPVLVLLPSSASRPVQRMITMARNLRDDLSSLFPPAPHCIRRSHQHRNGSKDANTQDPLQDYRLSPLITSHLITSILLGPIPLIRFSAI